MPDIDICSVIYAGTILHGPLGASQNRTLPGLLSMLGADTPVLDSFATPLGRTEPDIDLRILACLFFVLEAQTFDPGLIGTSIGRTLRSVIEAQTFAPDFIGTSIGRTLPSLHSLRSMLDADTIVHDSFAAPLGRTLLEICSMLDANAIVHDSFAAPLCRTVPPRIKTITAYLHLVTLLAEVALLTRFIQS
eukprot:scaffold7477_cov72-Skeletonema_dohrnii-CCMP3373.AAC.2